MSRQGPSENQLLLRRFCGDELFSVGEVSVWISHPGDGEEGGTLLNLEIHTRELLECSVVPEEERPLRDPRPTMEVWLPVPTLTPSELVGTSVHVKESYDASRDAMNRLYYCEHERMWGIDATFVEAAGDRCRVRLSGRSCDINHYSGDKPEAVVSADVWCTIPPRPPVRLSAGCPSSLWPGAIMAREHLERRRGPHAAAADQRMYRGAWARTSGPLRTWKRRTFWSPAGES